MYLLTPRFEISPQEVAQSLAAAQAYIPVQCNGSFMVEYPIGARELFAGIRHVQLVGLLPSQQIARHADASIAPWVRYHLPLQTNAHCWSYHAGEWQQLEVGQVYQMDPTQPHGAVNWGDTIRLHLMIDVEG